MNFGKCRLRFFNLLHVFRPSPRCSNLKWFSGIFFSFLKLVVLIKGEASNSILMGFASTNVHAFQPKPSVLGHGWRFSLKTSSEYSHDIPHRPRTDSGARAAHNKCKNGPRPTRSHSRPTKCLPGPCPRRFSWTTAAPRHILPQGGQPPDEQTNHQTSTMLHRRLKGKIVRNMSYLWSAAGPTGVKNVQRFIGVDGDAVHRLPLRYALVPVQISPPWPSTAFPVTIEHNRAQISPEIIKNVGRSVTNQSGPLKNDGVFGFMIGKRDSVIHDTLVVHLASSFDPTGPANDRSGLYDQIVIDFQRNSIIHEYVTSFKKKQEKIKNQKLILNF